MTETVQEASAPREPPPAAGDGPGGLASDTVEQAEAQVRLVEEAIDAASAGGDADRGGHGPDGSP